MSLEGDFHEVVVTPNLELMVTVGMSLKGVYQELYNIISLQAHTSNLGVTKNSSKKLPPN
jgi:hypothetical protein